MKQRTRVPRMPNNTFLAHPCAARVRLLQGLEACPSSTSPSVRRKKTGRRLPGLRGDGLKPGKEMHQDSTKKHGKMVKEQRQQNDAELCAHTSNKAPRSSTTGVRTRRCQYVVSATDRQPRLLDTSSSRPFAFAPRVGEEGTSSSCECIRSCMPSHNVTNSTYSALWLRPALHGWAIRAR